MGFLRLRSWTIDGKNGQRSIVHRLFDKCSTVDLFLQQFAIRVELHLDLDPLEAASAAHDDLADEVSRAVVIGAQIGSWVDTAFDGLAAASAFDGKRQQVTLRTGGPARKQFLQKTHGFLSATEEAVMVGI